MINPEEIAKGMGGKIAEYTGHWAAKTNLLFEEQSPAPGTPECEKFSDIAKALKEIEAERQRAAQAATMPEENK